MATDQPVVVCDEPIIASAMNRLRQHTEIVVSDLDDPSAAAHHQRADAVLIRSRVFDATAMDRYPRLRVIGRHGAGLDAIDLKAAGDRGIRIVNTPDANAASVAEFTLTMVLMLARKVPGAVAAMADGDFPPTSGSLPSQVHKSGLVSSELSSLTVGVVGCGAIGSRVSRLLSGIGVTCVGYDPYADPRQLDLPPLTGSLQELLDTADIVTLHVPGSADRAPLLDADMIGRMRPNAMLVNTARGSLVDADALADAVRDGRLGGAAVDVYAVEPPALTDRLLRTPGIVATPHMAAMTHEALHRMGHQLVDRMLAALGCHSPSQRQAR